MRNPGETTESLRSFLFTLTLLGVVGIGIFAGFLYFVRQHTAEQKAWWEAHNERWQDARVVRICSDGTNIWKLRTGILATRYANIEGTDPAKVCS